MSQTLGGVEAARVWGFRTAYSPAQARARDIHEVQSHVDGHKRHMVARRFAVRHAAASAPLYRLTLSIEQKVEAGEVAAFADRDMRALLAEDFSRAGRRLEQSEPRPVGAGWFGLGRGHETFIFVAMDVGIGMGLVDESDAAALGANAARPSKSGALAPRQERSSSGSGGSERQS